MQAGWFDAHCHLDHLDDVDTAARAAVDRGVRGVLVAGVRPSRWAQQQAALASWSSAGGWGAAGAGLHPWAVDRLDADELAAELEALDRLLEARPSELVALGELGLDFRRAREADHRQRQEEVAREQLARARRADLPVVLHAVGADDALERLIRRDGLPTAGGMVHGFTGSAEQARRWLRLGLHLSVGGPVTWRRSSRRTAGLAVIPLDRLLLESDAPDQPVASRGRGEGAPVDVLEVAAALGELRGLSVERLRQQSLHNAHRLFGLDRGSHTRPSAAPREGSAPGRSDP